MKNLRLLVLSLLFALSAQFTIAQTGNATITGRVADPSKAVIVGAEVILINTGTNVRYEGKTNGSGSYVITAIPPGSYRAEVGKPGFKTIVETGIVLHTQDAVELNFEMALGAVSESVTINANAEHMATDNPATGLLVDRTFVENMPLNGRSFQDLIALAPGAVSSADGSGLFSINGQRSNANYYTVDGVAANLVPGPFFNPEGLAGMLPAQTALGTTQALTSVDALQEFKIQTSGYTAEYGRQPGGQIELTTRSGSNDLHGSLFDYFRNDVLDANDWFFNKQGIPKQAERQNDFGGSIGGPLEIPKLYEGKDKTFYFISFEGLRLRQPTFSGIQDVPSVAFRNFAAASVQTFMNAIPLPNGPDNGDQCAIAEGQSFSCTAQWSAGYSNPSSLDALNLRVDQIIKQKFRLFARYANTPSHSSNRSSIASEIDTTSTKTRSWTVGMAATLTNNLLNELRFNYSFSAGNYSQNLEPFDGAVPYPRDLVIPTQYAPGGTPSFNLVRASLPGANSITFPSYYTSTTQQHQYNLVDSTSWSRGRHQAKFGIDFRRLLPLFDTFEYSPGIYFFTVAAVQNGFASEIDVVARQKAHPVISNLSLYAQDHWKVLPRLSLDYGVRWEVNPAPGASNGIYPLALTTGNLAVAQIAPRGTPQFQTTYHNFAPRLGFAYQAKSWQSHALVVRGGIGIFYDTGQGFGAAGYQGYPFFALSASTIVPLPASAAALAPPSLNFPLTPPYPFIYANDPNLRTPYTEEWNLSTDIGLGSKNTLTASYVGNVGRKLLFSGQYTSPSTINPAFTALYFASNAASSSYNALQLQDSGYVAPGMQLIASYTWAHALDNASNYYCCGSAPVRGGSNNDLRHSVNVALNYRIPNGGPNGFVRAVTRGWSLDNRFTAFSGYPVDVIQGFYTLPDGSQGLVRPDRVPGVPVYLHNVKAVVGGWQLNSAAFSAVPTDPNTGAPLRMGTLGRNTIFGPGFWSLNTAIQRNFPLHDRLQLIFRIEAFNILNHPNAGSIDPCLCDSTFGQSFTSSSGGVPTIGVPNPLYGTGAARSLQLALKLDF